MPNRSSAQRSEKSPPARRACCLPNQSAAVIRDVRRVKAQRPRISTPYAVNQGGTAQLRPWEKSRGRFDLVLLQPVFACKAFDAAELAGVVGDDG